MSDTTKPDHYNINAKICRLVEQYPCMYDRSHPHYLKKDVVDQAWIKISKEMNDSKKVKCKERWRNIRTSYARSINVNKIPASANRTKPYYLHEELQFLALHITPGIPVSRRSASYSLNGTNSSYTSPHNERGEASKVSICDESVDSYSAVMHEEIEDKSQYNQEERSSSTASDATSKNNQEMEQDLSTQNEEAPQLQQTQQKSPNNLTTAEVDIEQTEFHPPVVQIEEDNVGQQMQNTRRDSINYACAPPKKRLRVKDNCYASDNFLDTKPVDLLPQHDYDGIFLQGLLPEMKAMDFRQKIIFKRRIYEVLGEIFDNSTQASSTTNNQLPQTNAASSSSSASPIFAVNSSDINMLRRLSTLLQEPSMTLNNSTPARSASISSTVLSSPATPSSGSVPIAKIGATTRSCAHISRGRMTTNTNAAIPSQNVKEEPEGN